MGTTGPGRGREGRQLASAAVCWAEGVHEALDVALDARSGVEEDGGEEGPVDVGDRVETGAATLAVVQRPVLGEQEGCSGVLGGASGDDCGLGVGGGEDGGSSGTDQAKREAAD